MTRGKIQFIGTDWRVYSTVEFNGDMYPSGHGNEIITHFKNGGFQDKDDYEKYAFDFDDRNFGYGHSGYGLITSLGTYDGSSAFTFNEHYTDYLYIVNESEKDITLSSREDRESPGKDVILPAGKMAIVCFYTVEEIVSREKLVPKEMPGTRDIENILGVLESLSVTLERLQKLIADYGLRLQ